MSAGTSDSLLAPPCTPPPSVLLANGAAHHVLATPDLRSCSADRKAGRAFTDAHHGLRTRRMRVNPTSTSSRRPRPGSVHSNFDATFGATQLTSGPSPRPARPRHVRKTPPRGQMDRYRRGRWALGTQSVFRSLVPIPHCGAEVFVRGPCLSAVIVADIPCVQSYT